MALVDRVKGILMSPRAEWQVIDAEPATVASLYTGYIVPLAAIPAICSAIGMSLIGMSIPFVGGTLQDADGQRAHERGGACTCFGLVAVFIVALDRRCARADVRGNEESGAGAQGRRVLVHGVVGGRHLLADSRAQHGSDCSSRLYSLYLLYLGLPVLMKSPADKAVGYTVVVDHLRDHRDGGGRTSPLRRWASAWV